VLSLLALSASITLFAVGVLVQRAGHRAVDDKGLVAYGLRFPRQLSVAGVEAFLAGWTGSLPPWWKRWLTGVPTVVLEVEATADGINHRLLVPGRWSSFVTALLSAHLPSVRYEPIDVPRNRARVGAEYRLSTSQRPLAVDPAALSARLLATLQPLERGETVTLQYILGPAAPVPPTRLVTDSRDVPMFAVPDGVVATSEAAAALRQKHRAALLVAASRIGCAAATPGRAQTLVRHVEAAWHGVRAPGVMLRRRWLPGRLVAQRLRRRAVPLAGWPGGILNATEASGLIGWPIEVEQLPGLSLGSCRLLPVPLSVPQGGTVLGVGT
jgi:hypothetical protein